MAAQEQHLYERPSPAEAELAATGSRILAACSGVGDTATLRIIDSNTDITVPVTAIKMLADILEQMALGNAISIVPIHAELTTQEAANILYVSRPYLIQNILDPGKLEYHRVGNRRKIFFKDVMAYKKQQQIHSDRIMTELAALSQDMGIVE